MKGRYLVTVTLLSVTIAVLVLAVLGLSYVLVRQHGLTTLDTFNITESSVACSDPATPDVHCLCKKGNESQKICFRGTTDATVTIPLLHFSKSFSMETLSTDEDQGEPFHILNMEYAAFRHPLLADDTLCFRDMSDPKKPQRLCYVPQDHKAFVSGPTKFINLTI